MSAWREISRLKYVSPAAAPHVGRPSRSLAYGAISMLDPFRCSLPLAYRGLPSDVADAVALQSDVIMAGLDGRVTIAEMKRSRSATQGALFNPDDYSR
jgi:hypothetical protein